MILTALGIPLKQHSSSERKTEYSISHKPETEKVETINIKQL